MVESIMPDEVLDCREFNCPMPILKTKKTVDKMRSGQVLEILSTGAGTKNDLPAFAKKNGHEYLGDKDEEDFTRSFIKVK
jgi:tRNA 2-thiouridine synthesizing protein A